ncbi:HAMP domain-containing protein [Neisseriaceae bacterium TC5R-5]|nr:HAMP domain-containing protein [Neisseriaceae bacterium TC5R-5]
MSKLSGSLFFRLAGLVLLVVLTTQVFTLWMVRGERLRILEQQLYTQVVDTLAFLEGTMEPMSRRQRAEFLLSYNRPGLARLMPKQAGNDTNFANDNVPMLGQALAARLSQELGEPVEAHYTQQQERSELWISVHVLDHPYWLTIPFGRYSNRSLNAIIQAAVFASLFATALAFIMAWKVTRPIRRVVSASQQLASGNMPLPVPEQGPREIRALAHHFNQMAQALDNTAHERRLMLAGLSHDLRTPLTRLKLMLELQTNSADQLDMLANIDELSRIVRQFIDFARAEESSSRWEPVALAELASSVISRFTRDGSMAIQLICDKEPELEADALALERLLSNLLENARRYGTAPFIVQLKQTEDHAILDIIDHGPGIPASLHEAALSPFERLAEHRGTDGGSGLGLAIVARIIKQHRGVLQFHNVDDGSFRVHIELPLTQEHHTTANSSLKA